MNTRLATSAVAVSLATANAAFAQSSIVEELTKYVPDSVVQLLDASELLEAFSMTRNKQTDVRTATRIEYLATSGAVPRTFSEQQLARIDPYLSDAEMQRMSGDDLGAALGIIASSKPEVQKRGTIRALANE